MHPHPLAFVFAQVVLGRPPHRGVGLAVVLAAALLRGGVAAFEGPVALIGGCGTAARRVAP